MDKDNGILEEANNIVSCTGLTSDALPKVLQTSDLEQNSHTGVSTHYAPKGMDANVIVKGKITPPIGMCLGWPMVVKGLSTITLYRRE